MRVPCVNLDAGLRLTTDVLTTSSATLYSATRGYDAVGNVISEDTTLAAGTDNQLFCYDFAPKYKRPGDTPVYGAHRRGGNG